MSRVLDVEETELDLVDRRIINALAVEPRAPFRVLSAAIGVSDQTAARRYRRLQETAGLRVTGRVDGRRVGWTDWYLRLQCVPGAAAAVATALSGRPDTSWVTLASGGTEVLCALQARTAERRDSLLLEGLPGSRRVVHLAVHSVLHEYSPPTWSRLTGILSPAECRRLEPVTAVDSDDTIALTPEDETLLGHLAHDGRASSAGLAARIGQHESTVRRRIRDLRRSGVLGFDVDLDARVLGITVQAMLWISVEPRRIDATGKAMAAHPEVPFVCATTGATNLMAAVVCADTNHLYAYMTTRLAALGGVRSVESSPLIRLIKRSGPLRAPE